MYGVNTKFHEDPSITPTSKVIRRTATQTLYRQITFLFRSKQSAFPCMNMQYENEYTASLNFVRVGLLR